MAAGTQYAGYAQYQDDVFLFCVDANGELQWEQTYEMGKHVMAEDLCELADGGLLIAATGAAPTSVSTPCSCALIRQRMPPPSNPDGFTSG